MSPNHAAHAQRECGEDGFRLFAHAAPVKLVPEAHALTVFKQRARAEPAILAHAKTLPTLPSRPTAIDGISNQCACGVSPNHAADAPGKAHGHSRYFKQ